MSDQITILGPKINPPAVAAPLPARSTEYSAPVSCDDPGVTQWLTATVPPLGCHEISLAPQLFEEYRQAFNAVADDRKLQSKLDRGRPLTAAQRQTLAAVGQASDKIYEYGVNLFTNAFLAESTSPNSLRLWKDFASLAVKLPFELGKTNALLLMSSNKLSVADRRLLLAYCSDRSGKISPELAGRFAEHYRAAGTGYNGWQGGKYSSTSDIFIGVLAEILGPEEFEKFEAHLFRQAPQKYLVRLNQPEADQFSALDEEAFFQRYHELSKEFIQTAPGRLKVRLLRKVRDLEVLALARGFSLEAFKRDDLVRTLPGLSVNQYRTLLTVMFYSKHKTAEADLFRQPLLEKSLETFIKAYHKAPPHLKTSYASALNMLDSLAFDFGLSRAQLDNKLAEICRRLHCTLAPTARIERLADLKGQIVSVPPDGLPAEIKEILVKTGDWDLVRTNLADITFTPGIDLGSGISSLEARGVAMPILRRVEIDYTRPDGSPELPWEIAQVLVHEAAHVAWRKEELLLQQSTPDERNAYVTMLAFLTKYEKLFGPAAGIEEGKRWVRAAVINANQVLGYETNDLQPNTSLPATAFCQGFGLAGPKELDLSFYPTAPGPAYLVDRAQLAARLGSPAKKIEPEILDIIASVLDDQAELEINTGSPGVMVVREGRRIELTGNEVEALARSIGESVKNKEMLKASPGLYDRFVAAGNPIAGKLPVIITRVSAASLKAFLFSGEL